jgi:transketolase
MSATLVETDVLLQRAAWMRERIVDMAAQPLGAHVGGSLSATDILAVLFFGVLRLRPDEPDWPERDHLIMSKGHASAALYAALAGRGFLDEEELATYGHSGGRLAGHPLRRLPGVELSTGSLGHGLSLGLGFALAAARNGRPNRAFVVMGDGELQEGTVWEAAAAASALAVDNLTAVVDVNGWQMTGPTSDHGAGGASLADRWAAFGWAVREVDGHDVDVLSEALGSGPAAPGRPVVVLARTVKGRGVAFLEDDARSHYVKLSPRLHQRARASLAASAMGGARA